MPLLQKKEAGDNGGTYHISEDHSKGVLGGAEDLVRDEEGEPFNGMQVSEVKYPEGARTFLAIFKGGRRMAYFSERPSCEIAETKGCSFRVYRAPALRWEVNTFLGLLQGASVSQLLGSQLALVKGIHASPWELLPRVREVVLIDIVSHPEEVPQHQAIAYSKVLAQVLGS